MEIIVSCVSGGMASIRSYTRYIIKEQTTTQTPVCEDEDGTRSDEAVTSELYTLNSLYRV